MVDFRSVIQGVALHCLVLVLLSQIHNAHSKKITVVTSDNCEVCVNFMTKFMDSLDADTKSSPPKIEAQFKKACKNSKKDDNRFCYYIGGLEESATGILGEMSKPVSWGVPAEKVCFKLYKKDEQICELKYEKQIDLSNVDLKKLKVKELKAILTDWEEKCRGCTEKSDYIKLIEELMPKYAPDSYAKRNKNEEL